MSGPDAVVRATVAMPHAYGADARDRGYRSLTVRDEVFLLAHDGDDARRMRLVLNPRCLALGLAGAVLADLVLAGCLVVDHTRTSVRGDRSRLPDEVLADGWQRLNDHGRTLPLPTALGLLAPGLLQRTRAHLIAGDRLREVRPRMRRTRLVLTDAHLGVRVRARARAAVTGSDISDGLGLDPIAHALCVLLHALDLHQQLFINQPTADLRAAVEQTIARIPEHFAGTTGVGLPYIGTATKAAVGDAATSVY